jgi:hypothetical protein
MVFGKNASKFDKISVAKIGIISPQVLDAFKTF